MTTWAAADMEIVDLVPAEGDLRDLGLDVHAVIRCGWDNHVPIAFLTAGDRKEIKQFRKLIGTTVPIEMVGWPRKKGRFEADSIRLHRVRTLRKAWYSPRVREA
jgi:hypothetical protein